MVARAWPVSVEGDSGLAACCPETKEPHPHVSMTLLS